MSASVLLAAAAALSLFFFLLWVEAARSRDASHVDVGWALGLAALGPLYAWAGTGDPGRRALVAAMSSVWGLRLAAHLYFDRVRGKPEDGRYAALRKSWGADADRNFFFFFQAQGVLDLVLSLSFAAAAARAEPFGALDAAAAAVWATAVGGEALADRQLARFRADPANRGAVCRAGLWSWSRHPNYFFEWLVWLSYALLAPGDWRVWVAPPLMLYFLFRVTGVPATEAQALKSRGEAYRRYQDEVSVFIPLPPRRPS